MSDFITGMAFGGMGYTVVHGMGLIQETIPDCLPINECKVCLHPIQRKIFSLAGKVMQCLAMQQFTFFLVNVPVSGPMALLPFLPILTNVVQTLDRQPMSKCQANCDRAFSIANLLMDLTAKLVNGVALTYFWYCFNPVSGIVLGITLACLSIYCLKTSIRNELAFLQQKYPKPKMAAQ